MKSLLIGFLILGSFSTFAADTITSCSSAYGDYNVRITERDNKVSERLLFTNGEERGQVIKFLKMAKAKDSLLSGTSFFAQAEIKSDNGEEKVQGTIALVCNKF